MDRIACVATLLAVLLGASGAPAQEHATADTTGTGSTVLLPVGGYTPDTDLLFGGIALRFFPWNRNIPMRARRYSVRPLSTP